MYSWLAFVAFISVFTVNGFNSVYDRVCIPESKIIMIKQLDLSSEEN